MAAVAAENRGVRFTPKSCRDIRSPPRQLRAKTRRKQVQQLTRLFDHLVGGHKQLVRNCKTKHFGRFDVDHQFKFASGRSPLSTFGLVVMT